MAEKKDAATAAENTAEPKTLSLAEQAHAAQDRAEADLVIEQWSTPEREWKAVVVSMTARERYKITQPMMDAGGKIPDLEAFYMDVVIQVTRDPADVSKHVFSNADRKWLPEKNSAIIEEIATLGLKLSGVGKEEVDAAKKD